MPGSVGETSALCCLMGAAILIVTRIANWRIIAGGILALPSTSLFIYLIPGGKESWANAGPLYIFLPRIFIRHHLYGHGSGFSPGHQPGTLDLRYPHRFLTVTIRVANPAFMEGVMLAILFMNVFSPLLDYLVIKFRASKRIPNV